jgi:hypothetical protein
VGDQYAISMWCADAETIDFRYKALAVMPTRLGFDPRTMCLQDLSITLDFWPQLTGGSSPYVYSRAPLHWYHGSMHTSMSSAPATETVGFLLPNTTYRALRASYPDYDTTKHNDQVHASRFPYHYTQIVPTVVSFRKLPSAMA